MASILSFFSERSTGSNNMKKNREPSCETMESLHESATPSRLPLLDMDLMNHKARKKLNLIPLIFLIYFEVSGGPYGEEPVVRAAGPLLGIIGFVVFPFIWSIPEVLITAELSTTFPGNGGYVLWVNKAFGSFPASIMGSWKYLSGVINNAAYPVLCANYLKHAFPSFASGFERNITIAGFNLILSLLNYTGLTIVGYVAVTLGILSLLPFIIMGFISIPKIHPRRWVSLGEKGVKKDWSLYFNTLFWNLNFWDNVSALAGEVDQPQKTFPTALFFSIILACFGYLIPLLAGTGALPLTQDAWSDGFLAQVAGMIAGEWLKIWVEFGSVLSAIGLFQAQLSTCSYQLLGMAENGFLPHFFAFRSTWFDTPWVGILLSTVITLSISFMEFTDIISSANFLYCLSMLLEFSAFIYLRKKYPSVKRPYRIPMEIPGLVFMCVTPSAFLIYVMTVGTKIVYVLGCSLTVFGIALYFVVCFCKSRRLFKFIKLLEEEEENEE